MQDHASSHDPTAEIRKSPELSRHKQNLFENGDPNGPRLGRRESEPHSREVSDLFDTLSFHFPNDRTVWDLHHYFDLGMEEVDIQFDISYFRDCSIPQALPSYRASKFQNRIPTMAINIHSKSTWQMDLGVNMDTCRLLKIPLYILFSPFYVGNSQYKPPFLRVYRLNAWGNYEIQELRAICMQ